MANPLYEQLEGKKAQPDIQNQFGSFMQNPIAFLANRRINIPEEMQNDPHSAVNYLIQSGQMNQGALQKVIGTLQRMGFRF
jgi:hypothetical protein